MSVESQQAFAVEGPYLRRKANPMTATWFPFPTTTDFGPTNLPFGVYSTGGTTPRAGMAVGDQVLDLHGAARMGLFDDLSFHVDSLTLPVLNTFIDQGKRVSNGIRQIIQQQLHNEDSALRQRPRLFIPQKKTQLHLPVRVGDYTDFYSSEQHATNVGQLFRDPENALLPNWKHLPVAYHGRASSVVVSGTPIRRPRGQTLPRGATQPVFGPSRALDFELEVAAIIGQENSLGQPVSTAEAADYVFGLVLFNDWSARDLQRWEYVPLGPFLGKNFASSMSPWVVPPDALAPFRVAGPVQQPPVLPYLQYTEPGHYDIALSATLTPSGGPPTTVCRTNYRNLYWNVCQQIAHHTVNGCNLRTGDVLASGTISGTEPGSFGSLLESSRGGREPLSLADGRTRTYLENGDTVTLAGRAAPGVGFGEVSGQIIE